MLKKIKIPILASLLIMLLFVFKGFNTLSIINQDEILKNIFSIMRFEEKVTYNFISDKTLPNSVIYNYAIYDTSLKPVFSNLSKQPSDFKFVTMQEDGYLFYKNFFFKDKVPYFIVISQEISNKHNLFIFLIMLVFTLVLVVFIFYTFYIASVRPYKQAQKYMNNFFNDAMHELKTPLSVASINLEMIGITNKHTKRIQNALKQMQIAYEDVEYYIKKGHIKFPIESINFSEYLQRRVLFLLSIADTKDIVIDKNIDSDISVLMSKLALQRIIDNNIINAIKYSPKNSKVVVSLIKENGLAVFKIQDFGYGIKDINRVFKRYEREDLVQGGFGLGLNIVREICLKYDIKYNVVSKLNEGSIFTYTFKISKSTL
ncbi:sensor histidine kinase [Campylobacter pinnipediorum]|uniref:sensor histidine kinase n=1 Tax=Campylobacter pinnipediorum TaxID=1965231 RepID=UPI00084D0285|nr:HAMP domain-containing sensor histidine kinase [Campylobacter pinnipediorum]